MLNALVHQVLLRTLELKLVTYRAIALDRTAHAPVYELIVFSSKELGCQRNIAWYLTAIKLSKGTRESDSRRRLHLFQEA